MAHLVERMAYVGATPWHGLGQQLTEGAPIDQWRIESGLNFDYLKTPVRYQDNEYWIHQMDDNFVLYRSDNNKAMSIVSDRYKIVQPAEVLEFFNEFVEAGDMHLHTAGVLKEGKNIWALAKMNESFRIMGQDEVGGYLLLVTSCDGTMATVAKFTSVRVVCNNTLQFSLNEKGYQSIKVPHSRKFDANQVKADLGIGRTAFAEFEELVNHLAERKVSKAEQGQWLIETFGDPSKPAKEQSEADSKVMNQVWHSVVRSPGQNLRSANGTAWGLVNGATHYLDYAKRANTNDARFLNAQIGKGAELKQKAMANAIKLLAA